MPYRMIFSHNVVRSAGRKWLPTCIKHVFSGYYTNCIENCIQLNYRRQAFISEDIHGKEIPQH